MNDTKRIGLVAVLLLVILLAADVVMATMATVGFQFAPSAIKNTGGCASNCFRPMMFAITYCTAVVSNGMVMRTGGTLKLNYAINVQIANFTGTSIEVQADLIDNITNNNYLAQGFCGTFKGGIPQEFGLDLYFPFKSQFFGLSAVIDYPINTSPSNILVAGTTYYASLTFRPFAVNGTNMGSGTGSVNTRIGTPTTVGIGLLETS